MCNMEDIYEYITLLKPQKHDIIIMTCGPNTDVETAAKCHRSLDQFFRDEGLEYTLVTLPNEVEMATYCQKDGIQEIINFLKNIMPDEQYEDFIYEEFIRLHGDDLK